MNKKQIEETISLPFKPEFGTQNVENHAFKHKTRLKWLLGFTRNQSSTHE